LGECSAGRYITGVLRTAAATLGFALAVVVVRCAGVPEKFEGAVALVIYFCAVVHMLVSCAAKRCWRLVS
jgi:predicted phosphoribosyltransferase